MGLPGRAASAPERTVPTSYGLAGSSKALMSA